MIIPTHFKQFLLSTIIFIVSIITVASVVVSPINTYAQEALSTIRVVDATTGDPAFNEQLMVCIGDVFSLEIVSLSPYEINDLFNDDNVFEISAPAGSYRVVIAKNSGALDPETFCESGFLPGSPETQIVVFQDTVETLPGETVITTISGNVTANPEPEVELITVSTLELNSGEFGIFDTSFNGLPFYTEPERAVCINGILTNPTRTVTNVSIPQAGGPDQLGYVTVFDVSSIVSDSLTVVRVSYPYYYYEPDCSLLSVYPDYGTDIFVNFGTNPVTQNLYQFVIGPDYHPEPLPDIFSGFQVTEQRIAPTQPQDTASDSGNTTVQNDNQASPQPSESAMQNPTSSSSEMLVRTGGESFLLLGGLYVLFCAFLLIILADFNGKQSE